MLWIIYRTKEAWIKPHIYDDDNRFQNTASVVLSHKKVGKESQRIAKSNLFMNQYDCKLINSPPESKDLWRLEEKGLTVALYVFYAENKDEKNKLIFS